MKKRVLAAVLWFYCGWYAWSVIAWVAGVSDVAGPVVGLVAAVLFAGDPLKRIWYPRPASRALLTTSATPAADAA